MFRPARIENGQPGEFTTTMKQRAILTALLIATVVAISFYILLSTA